MVELDKVDEQFIEFATERVYKQFRGFFWVNKRKLREIIRLIYSCGRDTTPEKD